MIWSSSVSRTPEKWGSHEVSKGGKKEEKKKKKKKKKGKKGKRKRQVPTILQQEIHHLLREFRGVKIQPLPQQGQDLVGFVRSGERGLLIL